MRSHLILSLLLVPVFAIGQQKISQFPGSIFGIQLPDSSFRFVNQEFISKSLKTSFALVKEESGVNYREFMKQSMDWFDPERTKILVDKYKADSSRLIKVGLNADNTKINPPENLKKVIVWMYFQKNNNRPVMVSAAYPYESDKKLSDVIEKSLLTFKRIE